MREKMSSKSTKKKTARAISEERLERITHTRSHKLRTTGRVFKYGSKSFVRNTWLSVAAIAIMAITLLVLAATSIATHAMGTVIHQVESQVDMSVYIRQDAELEQIERIAGRMQQLETVTDVSYTSPEEAKNATIKELLKDSGNEDEAYIESLYNAPNKLPWTLNVKITNLDDTSELENFVNNDESMTGMLDAKPPSYATKNRETIDHIASITNRVQLIGFAAAAAFALIAILVVFNTIRMAIFNRKEEIYMMKLVGASRWFIMGPFVVEAAMYGIFAAIIAGATIYPVTYALRGQLSSTIEPTWEIMQHYWYLAISALLVIGIIIGIISALLATRKYLKLK